MRPGRRVITTMRSASVMASERSWVTKTTVCCLRLPERQQLGVQVELGVGVERAEGLVHQEDLGVHDQRAHQGHPLAHAARERGREGVLEALRARPARSPRARARARSAGGHAAVLEAERDVALHGAPRERRCPSGRRSRPAAAARRPTRSPSTTISPPDGATRPPIMLRMVDLPQPEGPTMATNSLSWTSKETRRDGGDLAGALGEGLREVPDGDADARRTTVTTCTWPAPS